MESDGWFSVQDPGAERGLLWLEFCLYILDLCGAKPSDGDQADGGAPAYEFTAQRTKFRRRPRWDGM